MPIVMPIVSGAVWRSGNAEHPDLVASVSQENLLRAGQSAANNFAHDDFDEHWQLVAGTLNAALTSHVHRQDQSRPKTEAAFLSAARGSGETRLERQDKW
jgi:hypothetical protein